MFGVSGLGRVIFGGRGYRVLGRNIRTRFGEVDLLAEAPDRRTVVLVEIKSRLVDSPHTGSGYQRGGGGSPTVPEVRVGHAKQRRLVALAGQLARRYGLTQRPIRFDVVGVDLMAGAAPVVRHHVGAFESHL